MSQENRQSTRPAGMGGRSAMGRPVDKPKNFNVTFRRLLTYLKPHRFKIFLVFTLSILSTLFVILGPKFIISPAINEIVKGFMQAIDPATKAVNPQLINIDLSKVGRILIAGLALYIASSVASLLMQMMMVTVSQKIVYQLRQEIDLKLTKLPLSYYDKTPVGESLSRVTNDVETISSTLQQSLTQMINSIITIIGFIIMMLTISVQFTLVALLTLPLSVLFTLLITKRSQNFFVGQQRELGVLNGHIEEVYSGHQVIKAFSQEEQALKQFDQTNQPLYKYNWKAQFVSGLMMPVLNLIGNLGYVIVAILGVQGIITGSISLGDVQAFISYMQNFTQPIVQTANIANVIQSAVAAAERVFNLLDEKAQKPSPADAMVIDHVKGDVKFDHVKFGYEKGKTIIHDLSFEAKPGKSIAIVGPTGAGKTTLVNLLMRFYEIDHGKIMIDDIQTSQMKRETVRGLFGMVLQDTWLFNGTIKENIRYSRLGATDEEVYDAAKAAYVDQFIRSLPQGYDTMIDENASNISQGQKQLLTIARAILADPKLLILDEATSSVDTRTEILIQNAMEKLMKGRTSFVIAHRLSTIKNADLILVMDHGDIIEQGNHQQLMKLNGFYANLYNSQFAED